METNGHVPTLIRPQPHRPLLNGRTHNRRKGQPFRRHAIYSPYINYSKDGLRHLSRDNTLNYFDRTVGSNPPFNFDMFTYALKMTGGIPLSQRRSQFPESRPGLGLEALRHFIPKPFHLVSNADVYSSNFMFRSPHEILTMMSQAYSQFNERYRYDKDIQNEIEDMTDINEQTSSSSTPVNVEDMDEPEHQTDRARYETTTTEKKNQETEPEPSPSPRFQCTNCKAVFNYQTTLVEHLTNHCEVARETMATEDALGLVLSTEPDIDVDDIESDASAQIRHDDKDDAIDPNIPLDLRMESKKTTAIGNKDETIDEALAEVNIDSEGFQGSYNTLQSSNMDLCTDSGSFFESSTDNERYLSRRLQYFQSIPTIQEKLSQTLSFDDYMYLETGEVFQGASNFVPLKEIHVCRICSKQFNSMTNLQRHKIVHTGSEPFSCESVFTHQSNKRLHVALHTGYKPYSCCYCSKTYTSKNQLKDHLVKHTGQKSYRCAFCDTAFAHRFSLRQHLLLKHPQGQIDPLKNDEYRPFTCDICFKKFTQLSSLKTHKRLHSGIKPFCCPVCWKCFPRKDTLTRHQYRHATERPFKCDRCEKSFATRYMLKQHSAGHLFEKRCDSYVCKVCGLDLGTRQKLTQHVKVHDASELRDMR